MAIERERKFLVKDRIPNLLGVDQVDIFQAYLVLTKDTQLRLRVFHINDFDGAQIAFKQFLNETDRIELEYSIDIDEAYETIRKKEYICALNKIRYKLDGWDIDVYPNGLIIAEYEFSDENPFPEKLPYWIGEEITGVEEYSNIYIAKNFEKFS